MLVTDAVEITGTRVTATGYLVVDARFARSGIQVYSGAEMGDASRGVVRVYRPEAEVFSDRAMGSFAHKPVTHDHPAEMVTAANWRDTAVGQTGDTVTRDGEHVRIAFSLMDAATIKAVQDGKRELSAGYTAEIKWTPGVTDAGDAYDAVMESITGNHLAIVQRGRAGASCRIGDAWTVPNHEGARNMPENLRSVLVDGLTISTTDQGVQAIEKLQRELADARGNVTSRDGQIAALTSAHAGTLAAKDGEIVALNQAHAGVVAAKDAEIGTLKGLTDAAAIDAAIEARASVIAVAKRVLGDGFDPKGKTVADMQAAVVTKRLGDAAVAGRAPEFFAAAFDTLALADAGTSKSDPIRDAMRGGLSKPVTATDAASAHAEMIARMTSGWQTQKGAA